MPCTGIITMLHATKANPIHLNIDIMQPFKQATWSQELSMGGPTKSQLEPVAGVRKKLQSDLQFKPASLKRKPCTNGVTQNLRLSLAPEVPEPDAKPIIPTKAFRFIEECQALHKLFEKVAICYFCKKGSPVIQCCMTV
jgi:hypothetical protein